MNLRLIRFFYENDRGFLLDLLRKTLHKCLFIDINALIASFQYFDNFSEVNPYKSLSLSSKPHEMLDFHYKRIILISALLGKSFISLKDPAFLSEVLSEISDNLKGNSSKILLLFSIYSEIVSNERSVVQKLRECSIESLEAIINLDVVELQREDINDLESSIFSNLHTLKILISNSSKPGSFTPALADFLKLAPLEKRRKMEEIYHKVPNQSPSLNSPFLASGPQQQQ